jgi:hypothetical protein
MKTAEQIADQTNHLTGRLNIKAINKMYRNQARGQLIERAIRLARGRMGTCGTVYGLEYCHLLIDLMNQINDKVYA